MCKHRKSPAAEPQNLPVEGIQSEGLGIDSLAGKLKRYAGGKERALRMADYIKLNHKREINLAADLKSCASYLVFKHYYTVDELRLHSAITCKKHLLCPFCAMRRASKYLQNYLEKIDQLTDQGIINDELKPYFVTLTVKDMESLPEAFSKLKNAFTRYTKQRRNVIKRGGACEFAKAVGGVYSYEVKRGAGSGLWHPHVHMVWWCADQPSQSELAKEWHSLTKDSFIVDIRPLTAREGESSVISGFIEVFKYALKFSDMTPDDNWEAYKFLSRKRLVSSFGFLRGVKAPESLLDDDLAANLPYLLLFYQYTQGGYSFTRSQAVDEATGNE